jgi:hypothetical protein
MADGKKGWNLGDGKKTMDDYNDRAFLTNFPPEARWSVVQGLLISHEPSRNPDQLVSIGGRDHKGEETAIWMSRDNALYLLQMLYSWARDHKLEPVTQEPAPTKPHTLQSP